MDKTRNEFIRGTAQVERFGDKVREARQRWFSHVQRRDGGYMELTIRRKSGRPQRRFVEFMKEDGWCNRGGGGR